MGNTWDILRGDAVIATVHELEYHAEWMGDEYVTVTVKSPSPIDFHFGDTLTYREEAFRINYDPNVVKKAKQGSYQEGFTYDNIKLYSDASKMKTIDFKDVVLQDNDLPYTSLSTFSFYADSVEDLADRLQANLNRETTGWRVLTSSRSRCQQRGISIADWSDYFSVDGIQGERDVNVEITDAERCWETLKFAYEKFGLAYYVTGKTVVIGGDAVKADHIFRYGKNNGLHEIERTSDENQEIVTKLFAYGSENNIPLNYYANLGKKMFTVGVRDTIGTETTGYTYGLKTTIPYNSIKNATNNGVRITLQYGERTVNSNCDSYMDDNVKYVWWYFTNDQGTADVDFYNALGEGEKKVYVVGGANLNLWPADYVEIPQDYDYPALLSINKLMLPGFPDISLDEWVLGKIDSTTGEEKAQWETIYDKYTFSTDKHDPWIASGNVTAIGIKEGIVNYDGSQQKEIKPTIEGTGYDEVMWAEQMDDNGYLGEDAQDGDFLFDFMPMGDPDGIDWKDNDGSLTISMKDGTCVGREFKVKTETIHKNDNGDWVMTLERVKDDSMGRYFPYKEATMLAAYYQVMGRGNWQAAHAGDHFVATGLHLQKSFVDAAAEKLFIAACGYLDKRDHMRYTYLPKIDEIYMQRQDDYIESGATDKPLIYGTKSYHDTLHAGMKLEFEDSDLGIWHSPFIDVITIKENGNNGIPTYDVVLRDEKEKGALEKLTDKIADLQKPVIAPTERQTRPSRNVDYPEWESGHAYYYQTLNPEPDENGVVYIETSYVWHRGKKWMCLRSLTTEEPQLGCNDWKVVEGNQDFTIEFSSTNGSSFYQGYVNTTVTAYLYWGDDDVTNKAATKKWERSTESGKTDADRAWDAIPAHIGTNVLALTDNDMPTAWSRSNKAVFTSTMTIADGQNTVVVMNRVMV